MTALALAVVAVGAITGVIGALLVAGRTGAGRHVRPAGQPRTRHATPTRHHARSTP